MIEVMGLSARSITVSTVGMVPGIKRLAEEPWPLYLAVSLHAADDELRTALVPINKPIPDRRARGGGRRILRQEGAPTLDRVDHDGRGNDTLDQADKLASIAQDFGPTST